ncbi:hypothetical protein ILUMI_12805, partial [Ignelater luminosus]
EAIRIPECLNADEKQMRVTTSQWICNQFNDEKSKFLDRVVTTDKIWVHHHDSEIKEISKEWKHSSSPKLKKFCVQKVPNNWELSNAAEVDWMKGFMERYPDLSLRKPEPTKRIQLKYNDKIINVDESGVSTVLAVPKTVAPKRCKQVDHTVSGERR